MTHRQRGLQDNAWMTYPAPARSFLPSTRTPGPARVSTRRALGHAPTNKSPPSRTLRGLYKGVRRSYAKGGGHPPGQFITSTPGKGQYYHPGASHPYEAWTSTGPETIPNLTQCWQPPKTDHPLRKIQVYWSDAVAGAIACGQTKQIKRQHASNHANQHKLMNFETGPAPQNPKATPRLAEVVAWLGRPQRGGLCFFN